MTETADRTYSSDWIGMEGLDVEDADYCVTLLRGVEPREALLRLGATDDTLRTAEWDQLREFPEGTAAFVVDAWTIVVTAAGHSDEEEVYRLSRGNEVVTATRSVDFGSHLLIGRDGEWLAWVDGDDPGTIRADEPLRTRLAGLVAAASAPVGPESELVWADLLQVACTYAGVRPTVQHVRGPLLGASVQR
jgi:hypothetical protein